MDSCRLVDLLKSAAPGRTGKTTRMLVQAVLAVLQGKNVAILAHGEAGCHMLRERVRVLLEAAIGASNLSPRRCTRSAVYVDSLVAGHTVGVVFYPASIGLPLGTRFDDIFVDNAVPFYELRPEMLSHLNQQGDSPSQ